MLGSGSGTEKTGLKKKTTIVSSGKDKLSTSSMNTTKGANGSEATSKKLAPEDYKKRHSLLVTSS